jgi:hypothetical protein
VNRFERWPVLAGRPALSLSGELSRSLSKATERKPFIFPSWWSDEGNLFVIDLGIDESGKSGDRLIVSALLGQTTRMKKLKAKWAAHIAEAGIDFFHAKEHWNGRSKAYRGLSANKRKSLLESLSSDIGKYSRLSIGVEIDIKDFEARASDRFKNTFGSAYAFGIHLMLVILRLEASPRT